MVQVRQYDYSTETIEGMLLPRVEELARELAPSGKRRGHEWVALNPTRADNSLGSFSINLHTGKWMDGSSAEASSRTFPVLSLVAYLATQGEFGDAIKWAKDWLGLTGTRPDRAKAAAQTEEAKARQLQREIDEASQKERKRKSAHGIWLHGAELDGVCAASQYLLERGIDVTALPHIPSALRLNPTVKIATITGTPHLAMVAAMHREGAPDGFAAVHATYLKFSDSSDKWVKAFGKDSKKMLGDPAGAAVRLTRGPSNRPLAKAVPGEWVGVAEGIENALSAAIVTKDLVMEPHKKLGLGPGLRMLAAGTLGNIGKVHLPPQIGGVFVIADNDSLGSPANMALENACNKLVDRGFDMDLIRAPRGYKDFNDALLNKVAA